MLSINTPTWQTSLLTAARERSGRQWPTFDRGRTASEVLPRVYLTDLFTARDETQLSTLGITHVISVIEHAPTFPQTHPLRTLHIPLSDSSDQDILAHLPTTTSFIRDALAESPDSRVMVHCLMGISRSATVVCAEKRGIVSPNIGFLSQLDRYADQLLGGQGRPRRAKMGKNVAETMRKLREAQRGSKPGSSSSTSTSTISDVTSAPSG
ncbi:protein-tyrosine phosphatase-like protein [Lactarius pseudohatsudake]|nr:protein-tyrosine phosphatase-like protein [Lactarius pseudohatsudake]